MNIITFSSGQPERIPPSRLPHSTSMSIESYKLLVAVILASLLALQRSIGFYATGEFKAALGYAVSLAFLVAITEFGTPILGRLLPLRHTKEKITYIRISIILTVLLLINSLSRELAPFLALLRRPLPTYPLVILICWWAAMVLWALRRGYSTAWLTISLVGLVAGTRLLVLRMWPFGRIDGDMLATIARAFDALASGKFPYVDYPPPMPYLPGTFLMYAPAKATGLDLRYTNIVCDIISILIVQRFSHSHNIFKNQSAPLFHEGSTALAGQSLLPCFMLHPVWVQYSVNSHFPPSLLFSVLLGVSVLLASPMVQAVALGIAVGSNQMLGACGPVLFASWASCAGVKRAAGLTLVATAVFLLILAPFLLWEPRQFLQIAFFSRNAFSDQLMAGRLTLFPLVSKFIPYASVTCSVIALAVASWTAFIARRRTVTATAMASGLCAALLCQPTSFTHYYLPALVMILVIPVSGRHEANPTDVSMRT